MTAEFVSSKVGAVKCGVVGVMCTPPFGVWYPAQAQTSPTIAYVKQKKTPGAGSATSTTGPAQSPELYRCPYSMHLVSSHEEI